MGRGVCIRPHDLEQITRSLQLRLSPARSQAPLAPQGRALGPSAPQPCSIPGALKVVRPGDAACVRPALRGSGQRGDRDGMVWSRCGTAPSSTPSLSPLPLVPGTTSTCAHAQGNHGRSHGTCQPACPRWLPQMTLNERHIKGDTSAEHGVWAGPTPDSTGGAIRAPTHNPAPHRRSRMTVQNYCKCSVGCVVHTHFFTVTPLRR